ncbi:ribonuclease H-like domain-containing protein [Tanacetum coccineum]
MRRIPFTQRLCDGIYPEWVSFVKSVTNLSDDDYKRLRYNGMHEGARKDVERAFGALNKQWATLATLTRAYIKEKLANIMYTCIILHNMIIKDRKAAICPKWYLEKAHQPDDLIRSDEQRHRIISDPSTSAHQTSQLPPPTFDFPNPQPKTETIHEPPRTHPMITRSQSGIVKPIDCLSLHTSSISSIPKNPSHALKDPNWRNAMYDEYNALVKNGTWLLVPRPAGVNIVRSMWLFKHKFHADGTLNCYKPRLVANGSSQQLDVGFDETSVVVDNRTSMFVFYEILLWMKKHSGLVSAGSQVAYLLIYVDDIILTAFCPALLQQIIGSLNNKFDMTGLGALNYFLGISADCTPIGLRNLLRELHSPLSTATLVYCDNVSAVYMSANPVQHQRTKHIEIDIHFVRDMVTAGQGTLDLGLHLYASSTTSLVGYTDADWAGCPSTRSAKAEYRGVANVVVETARLRNLLRELRSPLSTATLVYCDNVSAVYMSANPVQHQRTKHIEIDIHFVRDMVTAGQVRVLHLPSRFQYTDIFTKGLPSALFEEFRSSLSVQPPPAPTTGVY